MKKFPTAQQAAALTPEDLEMWSLEQDLKEIKKQIFWAIIAGKGYITRLTLRNITKSFLIEQGYYIVEDQGHYTIYWIFNPAKLKDKNVNKDFKKYATGGVTNLNSICAKDRRVICDNDYSNYHLPTEDVLKKLVPTEDVLRELAEKFQNKKIDNLKI